MMRSTDTWHGRPNLAAVFAVGREHAFGAARVEHHRRRPVDGRAGEAAFERRDDASALAGAAVFGGQHELDAERAGRNRDRTARRRAARRRTASHVTPRARSASASAANGASPTPPATIQASVGGSTIVNGRPSGPRHAAICPGRAS